MAGRFIALAGTDAFLPDTAGGRGLTEGTILGVRVTRAAQGGKGPRVTADLTDAERVLIGNGPPALISRGPGAVERLATLHPGSTVRTDDPALTTALRPVLGDRVATGDGLFDETVLTAIEALSAPEVAIPSGGTLRIHPTPALVAIDVDTGQASGSRTRKAAAQQQFNRALLPFLARQVRLRNLSGAILVDFAGQAVRRRAALGPDLAVALQDDPLRPRFLGFTALGLAEIVRPRVHPPLHEVLAGPHAAGLAALRLAAREAAAHPGRTRTLRAAPPVVAALQADPGALADLARRTGHPLVLRSDPTLSDLGWTVAMT